MIKKLKKHLIISIIISVVIYLGFSLYSDIDQIKELLFSVSIPFLFFLFALSLMNYFLRFFKWQYYLTLLELKVSYKNSLLIFFSGLSMSVTPGKAGESLKSFLLKSKENIPLSRSLPILFAERITDFISLLILAAIGSIIFNFGIILVVVIAIGLILVVLIFSNEKSLNKLFQILSRAKFLKNYLDSLSNSLDTVKTLLRPMPIIFMTLLSLAAWFFECLGFYLLLSSFNYIFSILVPTFIYSFSTIAGAVSILPAGLGITDGSLTFLLLENGVSQEVSVAATILIRITTLWFAVFIGTISLIIFRFKNKNLIL